MPVVYPVPAAPAIKIVITESANVPAPPVVVAMTLEPPVIIPVVIAVALEAPVLIRCA